MNEPIDTMTLYALEHSQNGLSHNCTTTYAEDMAKSYKLVEALDKFIGPEYPLFLVMNALFRVAKLRMHRAMIK